MSMRSGDLSEVNSFRCYPCRMFKSLISICLLKTPVLNSFFRDYLNLRQFRNDLVELYKDKTNIRNLFFSEIRIPDSYDLVTEFAKYGSDKVSRHTYGNLYENCLSPLEHQSLNFLEIGIHRGASLRAIHSRFPKWTIFGADIRQDCLLNEEGITSFLVDQFSSADWASFRSKMGTSKLTFVIDDGFHTFQSSYFSFMNLKSCLHKDFTYFIEDVLTSDLDKWRLFAAMTPEYEFIFVCSDSKQNDRNDNNILIITSLNSSKISEVLYAS